MSKIGFVITMLYTLRRNNLASHYISTSNLRRIVSGSSADEQAEDCCGGVNLGPPPGQPENDYRIHLSSLCQADIKPD